jgi:hypothetical protein
MTLTRKLHPTDISVRDDPDARALVLMCDEHEVGRISYEEAFRTLRTGVKPQDLIQKAIAEANLEWAMGLG